VKGLSNPEMVVEVMGLHEFVNKVRISLYHILVHHVLPETNSKLP
jgi:hypothetical protein